MLFRSVDCNHVRADSPIEVSGDHTDLVLHTLNLQLACGMDLSVPTDAVALVDRILLDLADRADPVGLALALSGRSGPRGANVLG